MVPSMARNTIDFGIDLGTTNSEIAFVDKGKSMSSETDFATKLRLGGQDRP